MKIGIQLCFWALVLIHAPFLDAGRSDSGIKVGRGVDLDMLAELSRKLTPTECEMTIAFLAKQLSNPIAEKEIGNIAGKGENFNCYEALSYWNQKNLDKHALAVLAEAVDSSGRADAKDWILSGTKYMDPKAITNSASAQRNNEDFEKAGDMNTAGNPLMITDDAVKSEEDSEPEESDAAMQYALGGAVILGLVMICFGICTAIRCARPRFDGQNFVNEVGVADYEFVGERGHHEPCEFGTINVKMSILKESSESQRSARKSTKKVHIVEPGVVASGENIEDPVAVIQQ